MTRAHRTYLAPSFEADIPCWSAKTVMADKLCIIQSFSLADMKSTQGSAANGLLFFFKVVISPLERTGIYIIRKLAQFVQHFQISDAFISIGWK